MGLKVPGKEAKDLWLKAKKSSKIVCIALDRICKCRRRSSMFNTAEKLIALGYNKILRDVAYMKAEGPEFVLSRRASILTKEGVLWT